MKVWAFRHAYAAVAEMTLRKTYPEAYARWFPQLGLLKVCSFSYSAGMQSTYNLMSPLSL